MIKQKHFIIKISILISFLFVGLIAQSQTKIIAHKSHSGSVSTFSKAYKNNLFDINCSNFGLPGNADVVVLDSVIAVNDSKILLKKRVSNHCYPFGTNYKKLKESDFERKTDTIYNHNLLNRNNAVSFIKSSYKHAFSNPIEEVVFIGFKE